MNSKVLAQLSEIEELKNKVDGDITGITDRSSSVKEGFVFVAIKGFKVDGHEYIDQAISNGAKAIVGERKIEDCSIPYIHVENSRKAVGQLAAAFYGFPCQNKTVIGVTGTNGKTTTALFIRHLMKKMGHSVSFFGTVFNEVNGERTKSYLTTPSANDIQRELAQSEDDVVVIEVSSQGLEQHRMQGMAFDYALFTNLQHDHLDYHHTIEEYFLAKKRLFHLLKEDGKAIVYTDDSWGKKLSLLLQEKEVSVLTVAEKEEATIQLSELSLSKARVKTKDGSSHLLRSPLPGSYNVLNAALASAVAVDMGKTVENVDTWLEDMEGIPGRFDEYVVSDHLRVIVDYAHTPEALEVLLKAVKEKYPKAGVTHIFGFRGNRDKTKRPEMVDVSATYSEYTVLTSDDLNGVSESEMKSEYDEHANEAIQVIMDRTEAIKIAVDVCRTFVDRPQVIVVTGKGHENYQKEFMLGTHSDKETVEYLMK